VGRTCTGPARGASVRSLAFAFASCQRWDEGFYSAYRRLAEEDVEFVVHLGDYLYEYGIDENGGYRNVSVPDQFRPECATLDRAGCSTRFTKATRTCGAPTSGALDRDLR
jgi:alkaline phosphatase D